MWERTIRGAGDSVANRRLETLTLTRAETVERRGEVVDRTRDIEGLLSKKAMADVATDSQGDPRRPSGLEQGQSAVYDQDLSSDVAGGPRKQEHARRRHLPRGALAPERHGCPFPGGSSAGGPATHRGID